MASTILSLLLSLTLLSSSLSTAAANLRRTTTLFPSQSDSELTTSAAEAAPPTAYFEVTKPIPLPATKPCSYLLLRHDFNGTYGQPPVLAAFTPPSDLVQRSRIWFRDPISPSLSQPKHCLTPSFPSVEQRQQRVAAAADSIRDSASRLRDTCSTSATPLRHSSSSAVSSTQLSVTTRGSGCNWAAAPPL